MHSNQNKRPRAILFDHDGVLVASEALHWKAWELLIRELGLPYDGTTDSLIRSMVGKTAPMILSRVLDLFRPGWTREQFDIDALARHKNDFYLRIAATDLHSYPGVPEFLSWLREQGIPTAVVSNAKRRELEAALQQLGLIDFFTCVVSRDDIQPPKPDPAPYLFAAAHLGMEPADCLAVEDSPTGIEAALVGRIPAAAVLTNFPRAAMEQPVPGRPDLRPAWIGSGIRELHAWVASLPTP